MPYSIALSRIYVSRLTESSLTNVGQIIKTPVVSYRQFHVWCVVDPCRSTNSTTSFLLEYPVNCQPEGHYGVLGSVISRVDCTSPTPRTSTCKPCIVNKWLSNTNISTEIEEMVFQSTFISSAPAQTFLQSLGKLQSLTIIITDSWEWLAALKFLSYTSRILPQLMCYV